MAEAWAGSQPRRTFLRFAGVGLAVVLAGCQGMVPKTTPPAKPAPPPTVERPVGPGLPTDQERHRVALLVPMTGTNAAVGQSIANAANLALLDTGGAKVRITTYDTAPGAAAAAQRALADGNRLFLGPLLADDVRAIAAPARGAGVPVISFSNDASVAGNGVYLLGFSPAQSIDRVVRYARSQGSTKFAGLMPTGLYGRNASNALIHSAEASGGSVVSLQTFDRSPKSLTTAIGKLNQSGDYDAVLIADGGRIAVQAAPQIRKAGGANAKILGTELWATESTLAANPAMNGAWFASVQENMYRQLATKYRARFGKPPYRLASLGYDAVLLTVRIAGQWKVGDRFPVKALTDSDGFAGVDGAFRFGTDGVAERALAVHQIGTGGISTVAPAPRGFGK
ncbi:amino acid/amide ABC transporter substrate-binding protein, HAAT family [Sphingomonas laterariae]|uniref:Amino acid/amide ABC transporter substrate-binding protein, HAAT family n=1 Tax=Edaphosphingomonas laterariae TaxID=861865 RepID=A0A239DJK9_9SPHN|nr:penicillin-binding protein activator [Sphingomonas laterariae]SNS32597.1 amino acid/amide ABC transporter substrate-binding protein, HAAT family [Sphingomonas laterariae]